MYRTTVAKSPFPEPCERNAHLVEHVTLLRNSLRRHAGRDLVNPSLSALNAAREVFFAPFAVLSHDTSEDPIFNYANRIALELFELSWQEFTALPSRQSAEPSNREKRAQLLEEVSSKGFIDDYSGVRISKSGKRFLIEKTTIWNLIDEQGRYSGQAAIFPSWKYL